MLQLCERTCYLAVSTSLWFDFPGAYDGSAAYRIDGNTENVGYSRPRRAKGWVSLRTLRHHHPFVSFAGIAIEYEFGLSASRFLTDDDSVSWRWSEATTRNQKSRTTGKKVKLSAWSSFSCAPCLFSRFCDLAELMDISSCSGHWHQVPEYWMCIWWFFFALNLAQIVIKVADQGHHIIVW